MKKIIIAVIVALLPIAANAQFTISMYKDLKVKARSTDKYVADKSNDTINLYLTGVAVGAKWGVLFSEVNNSDATGYKKQFCLPDGSTINSDFARYIVDSVLNDKNLKDVALDSTDIGMAYLIGVSRYFPCK